MKDSTFLPVVIVFVFIILMSWVQPAHDQGRTLDEALSAVRAESAKVDALVARNTALQQDLTTLKAQVNAIQTKLDDLFDRAIVTHN